MPLERGGTLSAQEAWGVAAFINSPSAASRPRLQPEKSEETRDQCHNDDHFYGHEIGGFVMGSPQSLRDR
jgi:thiosulfate dehydrogenase